MMKNIVVCTFLFLFMGMFSFAQTNPKEAKEYRKSQGSKQSKAKPEDTEVWEPIPRVIQAGAVQFIDPASDAIILFDKDHLNEWVNVKDKAPAQWKVLGNYFTVNKATGDIETKKEFTNYQLHIEWRIPENIDYEGQSRGNSGVFLASTEGNAGGYELQVLEGYNNDNKTYVNGMVGSIYKEFIPLVNPARKAGEWNAYDVVWKAPKFNANGSVESKGRITVFLNGILIQDNVEIQGETAYIGKHEYTPHGASPIKLQAHGDPSVPIDYRNIWVRELQ